jgi:hypothetical protein
MHLIIHTKSLKHKKKNETMRPRNWKRAFCKSPFRFPVSTKFHFSDAPHHFQNPKIISWLYFRQLYLESRKHAPKGLEARFIYYLIAHALRGIGLRAWDLRLPMLCPDLQLRPERICSTMGGFYKLSMVSHAFGYCKYCFDLQGVRYVCRRYYKLHFFELTTAKRPLDMTYPYWYTIS